jgi:hypothetical protein
LLRGKIAQSTVCSAFLDGFRAVSRDSEIQHNLHSSRPLSRCCSGSAEAVPPRSARVPGHHAGRHGAGLRLACCVRSLTLPDLESNRPARLLASFAHRSARAVCSPAPARVTGCHWHDQPRSHPCVHRSRAGVRGTRASADYADSPSLLTVRWCRSCVGATGAANAAARCVPRLPRAGASAVCCPFQFASPKPRGKICWLIFLAAVRDAQDGVCGAARVQRVQSEAGPVCGHLGR